VPATESALHFAHFFRPSTAVSGDFFDILDLSDTMAGVFVCDVMGHGVRAALVAALVRALVEELKGIAAMPDEFLGKINRALVGILKQTEIPMFASASYVLVDLARGELRYVNAGHPDPLFVRPDSAAAEALPLAHGRRGPVLGMFDQAQYATATMPLTPGDKVLIFTDGLFEVEDPSGELYDQSRLIAAVSRRGNLGAADLCREVLAEVQDFAASHEFSDDVCVVAFEVARLLK
jgi:sigma-B regulation protein RsbU (phosphoserine phosphatase)